MPRLQWPADLTPRTFWADDQLAMRRDELRRYVARGAVAVTEVRRCPDQGRVPAGVHAPEFDDGSWPVMRPGERLAEGANQLVWLRGRVTVPSHLGGKRLALRFGEGVARGGHNNQAESLLYLNGEPYHGLDGNHRMVWLPEGLCREGRVITLAIQAWSGWAGYEQLRWQDPELIWVDEATDQLVFDFDALYRTIQLLDAHALARVELVRLAERALQTLDWTVPGSERFYESVRAARAVTSEGFAALKGRDGVKPTVTHVGHTHLDVAWLWTLDNIKLKTARSWASALRLMEAYPEFRWIQSQPQLYRYIKETQPELWAQVRRRVEEGRWEADGGMWVEADCNLSGGEGQSAQRLQVRL